MRLVIVAALVSIVQACAVGPINTPLSQQKRNSIKEVELYNLVIQDEIRPAVNLGYSGYTYNGLIGELAESATIKDINRAAQGIIEPLYTSSADLDYRVLSAKKFNEVLAKEFSLKEQKESAETKFISDEVINSRVAILDEGNAFLYLSHTYSFVNDSKNILTHTYASLYENVEAGKSKEAAKIYFNTFIYQSSAVGQGGESSMTLWADNDAALFREVIAESITRAANMLAYDLGDRGETCSNNVSFKLANTNPGQMSSLEGWLIEKDDSHSRIRATHGPLYSVPNAVSQNVTLKNKNSQACGQQVSTL